MNNFKDAVTLLKEPDNVDRTAFKKGIEASRRARDSILATEIIESGASFRDRKVNPDPRTTDTGFAIEIDKGFQAPFVLGEGPTLAEAWEQAKTNWEIEKEEKEPFTYEELDFIRQNWEHIDLIRKLLRVASTEILKRGETHDRSKLDRAEVSTFAKYTPKLKNSKFGSDEYKKNLAEMKEGSKSALESHYRHNRHHPEFGISKERWKPVKDFAGFYEISDRGNVRSLDREVKHSGIQKNLSIKGKNLKQNIVPKGYCRIQLSDKEGNTKNKFIHVLVAEAFLPEPDDKNLEINHIDGNKKNNSLNNLEWVTKSENLEHAYENELREPTCKYVVTCCELGITTLGTTQMELILKERGYEKARASRIWKCINHGGTHMGLTFQGDKILTWENSPVSHMSLIDLLEMFIDWLASTQRHPDGDIFRSIEINKKRFALSDDIVSILQNTARDLIDREK